MLILEGLVIKLNICIVVPSLPTLQLKEWVFNSAMIVVPITTTALIASITALVDAIAVFYVPSGICLPGTELFQSLFRMEF